MSAYSIRNFQTRMGRNRLIDILTTNREKHAKILAEAKGAFREKALAVLTDAVDSVSKGWVGHLNLPIVVPKSFIKEYDTIIDMLKASPDEFVSLTTEEYTSMVKDQWQWSREFLVSNAEYSSAAKHTLGSTSKE